MTKEKQQKLVSERDHIVIHRVTDNVIARHNNGTEVYAVEIVRRPLVRCKECKHNVGLSNGDGFWEEDIVCDYWDSDGLTAEDYCSYGERKDERSRR